MSVLSTMFIILFILVSSVFIALALWLDVDWVDEGDGK